MRASARLAGYLLLGLVVFTSGLRARSAQDASGIRADLDAGRYDRAEAAARERVRSTTDPREIPGALDLLVESLWRNGRADSRTRQLAEQAAAGREKAGDSAALALALTNLGRALLLAGESSLASVAFERSVKIRETRSEQDSLALADALDNFASALLVEGRYDQARSAIDRALVINEAAAAPDGIRLSQTLELSAQWFQKRGEYSRARPLLERALAFRSRTAPDHPAMAATLRLLGDQLWFEGAILESGAVYRRAVELSERTLRPDHPEIALALQNLATVELERGAMEDTLRLRQRALAIAESNFGTEHPLLSGYLNDLANAHFDRQDYSTARRLFERALRIKERRLGPGHESVATSVFNLAALSAELGDVVEAERLFRRAAQIWAKRLGPQHPFVATAWDGLAEALVENRRPQQALLPATRALGIRERSLGPDHVDVARTLLRLAAISTAGRRSRETSAFVSRALAIWEKVNPDSPGHALALLQGAQTEVTAGRYQAARAMFERAIAISSGAYGPVHMDVARAQQGLAAVLAHLDERALAFTTALRAESAVRATLRSTVRYLPERQALEFSLVPPAGLDLALSLVDDASDPLDAARTLDALVLGRGVILDEMAGRRRTAFDERQPQLASSWAAVASARQRLANLAVRTPSDDDPRRYTMLLEAARKDKETAERALAEKSAGFKQELEHGEVGLESVRLALPPASALISIVRYDRTVASQANTVPHYAAFVMVAGGSAPVVVQLGPASTIDRAITRWRSEAGLGLVRAASPPAAEAAYRIAGERLRKLVWDPLAPHVGNSTRVFIVPDGAISLLNFASLPVGTSEYLVERRPTIHYLGTERDLAAPLEAGSAGRGLFALGGPAFDDAGAVQRRSNTELRGASSPCATLQSLVFGALPGTLREATEVAALWKAASGAPGSGEVQLSVAARATERAFKQQAPGRRVLHLATHGFFLGGDCAAAAPGTRAVGRVTAVRASIAPGIGAQNPLLVSGLAFAGANLRAKAKPADEDGILTAEEIAGMNLQGTEWAVLSACDTGLGEVKAGEGVFGLRRAFQIAGVRTVIMSLWSVEDQATREWMRALYRARLNEGLDTAESVRSASIHVLQDRRARRLSTHPFHWGAFVSAGDWR